MNPNINKDTWTNAQSTITGATSADVHTGLGKPVQGQTTNDVNESGKARGERSGAGDITLGGDEAIVGGRDLKTDDERKGGKGPDGNEKNNIIGAEEQVPTGTV